MSTTHVKYVGPFPIDFPLLGRQIRPGEVVEVDAKTAGSVAPEPQVLEDGADTTGMERHHIGSAPDGARVYAPPGEGLLARGDFQPASAPKKETHS